MRNLLLFLALALPVFAQEPIRYTLRFPQPHTHYVEVTASVPAAKPATEVFMAVWTPGSYLVREYSRNVEAFKAYDAKGNELAVEKTRKNRWKINGTAGGRIELKYKVYAHEMSVQGNWIDAGFAMMNGAPNFVTLVGGEVRPYEVTVERPAAWRRSISGMKETSPDHYWAKDFDELLDCPIYVGNAPIHEFDVEGKKHFLVNEGEGPMWDGPGSAKDVAKIVAAYSKIWGGLPYEKYVFFNMLVESGGGLEHRNSTWLGASKWAYGNAASQSEAEAGRRASRNGWLGLVSHEYVHLWNVKRLRPVELGPFDFENEVYTKSLWLAEGVTSYYGPLALRRAGLTNDQAAVRGMGGAIGQLQNTPGRLVTPVESASFNAWIQLYRPNENSPNTAISYYTKGQVIGFVLDAKIRKATNGAKSLDDAMRLAYQRYGGAKGYTPAEFRAVVNEVAGADFGSWFKNVLETTEELDYTEALEWYGLRFAAAPAGGAGGGRGGAAAAPASRILTGFNVNTASGRILITGLRRGTPGYEAGFNVDDEILAVNGYRVRAEQWPGRLESYKVGETVEVLIARREKLETLKLTVTQDKPASWNLEIKPDATAEQKAHLKAWLAE